MVAHPEWVEWWELADDLGTVGSASQPLSERARFLLASQRRIILAYDPDAAGRAGAARLAALGTRLTVATFPHPGDLTELPGVGRYTAAAIAAQADDRDAPAVDVAAVKLRPLRLVQEMAQRPPCAAAEVEHALAFPRPVGRQQALDSRARVVTDRIVSAQRAMSPRRGDRAQRGSSPRSERSG